MAAEIVCETHSISVHNEQGIASGRLPGELAEQAGRSPPSSANAAATTASRGLQLRPAPCRTDRGDRLRRVGLPLLEDRRLRECRYGEFDGRPVRELERLRARHTDEPGPDGQSYRDVVRQMADFLTDLAAAWDGRKVLLIAHSANAGRCSICCTASRCTSWSTGRSTGGPAGRSSCRTAGRARTRRAERAARPHTGDARRSRETPGRSPGGPRESGRDQGACPASAQS